jgi:uncharacterized protein YdhG (YjbR/CyaY superfamily)
MNKTRPTTVTEYINTAPKKAQKHLRELRALLKKVAPKAIEAIKWGSPVFEQKRILFAYTAFRTHINFIPTRSTLDVFKKELLGFKTGRDTVQLPHNKPLPKALIRKMATYRVKEVKEGSLWMHSKKSSK